MAEEPYPHNGAASYGKHADYKDADASSLGSDDTTTNAGVKAIEGISQAWSKGSLIAAYAGLVLTANMTSLAQQTTIPASNFALNSFTYANLISTIYVVSSIFYAVTQPVMAKISDVFGRFEAYIIAIILYIIGYILIAAANNLETYAAAQVFVAAGTTGLGIMHQIFIADTSDLTWRAFFSSLPDIPYVWTIWAGPPIFARIYNPNDLFSWRWAFGMWTIVVPVAIIPLLASLAINKRKAKKLGFYRGSPYGVAVRSFFSQVSNKSGNSHATKALGTILKDFWYDVDLFGLVLLAAWLSLLLIPLTIGPTAGWDSVPVIVMFAVGGACLITFVVWEVIPFLAPKPIFPQNVFRDRTILAAVFIAFVYFMYPYFFQYLLVVQGLSSTTATYIVEVFSISSSVTSVIVGLLIKWTNHSKYFITFGALIYTMGIGLMIAYRNSSASVGALVGVQIAVGIGGGMLNVPTQLNVQASVNHQQVAVVTAVWLTILQIGGAVGNAISGAVWSSSNLSKLRQYLPAGSQDLAPTIVGAYTAALEYPIGSPVRDAVIRSYDETMHKLLIGAVCVAALIVPASLLMKNYKLNEVKGLVIGGRENTTGEVEADGTTRRKSLGHDATI